MSAREIWNTINNFFGAYFHQDWREEANSPQGVLQIYLQEHNVREIRDLVKDIEKYMQAHPDDAELNRLLIEDLGSEYNPVNVGVSARQWMTWIANILRQEADRRSMGQT